jgi:trans-2-enoyl-CoA reductase
LPSGFMSWPRICAAVGIVAEKLGVLFEAQPAQPRRYVHAVILGSEER